MAQRSHVPRFGEWRENVQYTACFENARRDKGEQKMINPNDPEQNPSAFTDNQKNAEKPRRPNQTVNTSDIGDVNVTHLAPKYRMKERNFSELSSGRSCSDNSNNKFNHGGKSRRPISETDPSSTQAYQAINPAISQHAKTHHRVASVPKFGSWDERDPQSGDGFTFIFNKVKEQKQQTAANNPTVTIEPVSYPNKSKKKIKTSSNSKVQTCCFL